MACRKVASGRLKSSTLGIYDRTWRVHVSPRWRDAPLSEVGRLDVQKWLLRMTLGDGKVSIVVLRGIMAEAARVEVLESSNLAGVTFEFGGKSREHSKAVYALEEARSMLSTLRGLRCEAPFILACFGGMRTGESLACRCDEVSSIEVEGVLFAAVPVSRQMPDAGDEPEEWTKTKGSTRTALVPDPYASVLIGMVRSKLSNGVEWLSDRGDGLPMSKSALDRAWERDAGDARIPFSNLRPSWRTFAEFDREVPHATLEVLMGHALPGSRGGITSAPTRSRSPDSWRAPCAITDMLRIFWDMKLRFPR